MPPGIYRWSLLPPLKHPQCCACTCAVCCFRPVQALERAEAALADDCLSSGDRLALQRRVLRLGALAPLLPRHASSTLLWF